MSPDIQARIFGAVVFSAFAAFFGWLGGRSLRTGCAPIRFGMVERATQPRLFWLAVTLLLFALAVICAFGVVRFAISN